MLAESQEVSFLKFVLQSLGTLARALLFKRKKKEKYSSGKTPSYSPMLYSSSFCIFLPLLNSFGYVATFDCVWISMGCFHTTSSLYDLALPPPTQNSFSVTGKCILLRAFAFWNSYQGFFAFFFTFLINFALHWGDFPTLLLGLVCFVLFCYLLW